MKRKGAGLIPTLAKKKGFAGKAVVTVAARTSAPLRSLTLPSFSSESEAGKTSKKGKKKIRKIRP